MFEMSETIGALSKALAAAQVEIGSAKKTKLNPAFKSRYSDLAAVFDAWQAVGPAQGLAVTQFPGGFSDGKARVTSMLCHESGEWMRETLEIPVSKQDAQGCGSAITYARRFALAAIVGVCPDDDDGNAAVRTAPTGPQMAPSAPASGEWPNGPCTSKTALQAEYKAFVRNLHSATSSDDVEGLIDDAKPMLAQFRAAAKVGILTDDYRGGGDFKGVEATIGEARLRVAHDDGVPREPGDAAAVEDPTTAMLREKLEDCTSSQELKAWSTMNQPIIAEQPETVRDELRERFKARERAFRTVDRLAA